MKRTISLFILTAILAAQFAGCGENASVGGTTPSGETTTAGESTIDMSAVCELPDKRWGGREFRVLGRESERPQFTNFEIYSEGENGDLVNDAVYRRNVLIEDRYDVKITQTLLNEPKNELQKIVLAQEDLYDLSFIEIDHIGALAAEGYFYDLNNVGYIDFSKSYWNPDVNESLKIGNSLYFTSSDFALRDKNRVYIMAHNRDKLKDYKLESVVDLVRAGKWTGDKMNEYCKAVTQDVNNDGKMWIEDNYGIGFDSYNGFTAMMYGFGNKLLKNTGDGLEISMNNDHTIESIDEGLKIIENGLFCNDFEGKVDFDFWSTSSKLFYENQNLFVTCFPHSLKTYSEKCSFDYGVIPFPKFDEDQEKYYTMPDIWSMLFTIPITNPDPDFSGFMLEALSSESKTVLYNYYELTCKIKHVYDEDSAEMLDLIFDGIVYDLGNIFKVGLSGIYDSIARARTNNFASAYASKEESAKNKLSEIMEKFG